MIGRFGVAAAIAVAMSAAPQQAPTKTFAMLEQLDVQLLATRSATATLEAWCRDHRMADVPRVVARAVAGARNAPAPEQLRRLAVASAADVKYRRVSLQCGAHVLSDADNWYVPARLTAEMNRLLDTTDTPFGKVVAPLDPYRETIAVKLLWHDSTQPMPDTLFEHRAILYTKAHEPFSEVVERYRRDLVEVR